MVDPYTPAPAPRSRASAPLSLSAPARPRRPRCLETGRGVLMAKFVLAGEWPPAARRVLSWRPRALRRPRRARRDICWAVTACEAADTGHGWERRPCPPGAPVSAGQDPVNKQLCSTVASAVREACAGLREALRGRSVKVWDREAVPAKGTEPGSLLAQRGSDWT